MSVEPGIDEAWMETWMERAIVLAKGAARSGNYSIGALVVHDGEVLSETGSSLAVGHDPSAHPEMTVIRRAAELKRSRYLPGAYLVTTLEPCVMCTAVAIWAKMSGIVFGAGLDDVLAWAEAQPDDRPLSWRQIRLPAAVVVAAGEPRLDLHGGVLRAKCIELFGLSHVQTEPDQPT